MRKIAFLLLFFCVLSGELYSQANNSRRSPSYKPGTSRRSPMSERPAPRRGPARSLKREAPLRKEPAVNWDDLLEHKELRIPKTTDTKSTQIASNKKFEVKNELDQVFLKSLQDENREPSPLCSDEVFLRRVYLDLIGTVPTAREARSFLEDKSADKREKLIDSLLDRKEFADLQTMRWCDLLRVKSEFPINLWPNGAACYYRWIHKSVEDNKPYSQFVRELITANGSNVRDGASNFYRAVPAKDSDTLAEMVCRTFMDIEIAPWPKEKRSQIALFFSRVGYKETAQWKEEIVFWLREPLDRTEVIFPDGSVKRVAAHDDPRKLFADWLISPANTTFNVCAINRLWNWLFGQRLYQEPQDMQNTGRPIHFKLSQKLCQELIRSQYDLKQMYSLILNSGIYQQSSVPDDKHHDSGEYFTSYPIHRIEAEIFQDMLAQIFELSVGYTSEVAEPFTNIPSRFRTIVLPDASITSSFLEMFGRSSRDTGTETDRNNDVTESQQLFLLNSTEINEWIVQYVNHLKFNPQSDQIKDLFDEIWLTFLARFPTYEEYKTISEELARSDKPGSQKIQDIIWCLLNSSEFICKH